MIAAIKKKQINKIKFSISSSSTKYLSLPPTRHDLTQGQKPEGQLKWG